LKKYFILINIVINSAIFGQFDLGAGMGLNFFSAPDLKDYINSNFSSSNEMGSFNTSADFFIEFGYGLNENYQLGFEYTFNIYSFNSTFASGTYDLQLNQHKPSILGYYLIKGVGYKFKVGGGVGLRIAQVDEELYGTTVEYTTSGFGVMVKAQGDTKLGGNFYALIAGELRYDLPGDIETLSGGKFNVNSLGIALKLGTVYYF
jgi:hypothetical protein